MQDFPYSVDASSIRLLVSDVDGTLLDSHRTLTSSTRDAINRLRSNGIRFSLISARPPAAVVPLVDELSVSEPVGCFNGALVVSPAEEILSEVLMRASDAHTIAENIANRELDLWVFAKGNWYVSDLDGPRVHEHHLDTKITPMPLTSIDELETDTAKLVAVSMDFARLQEFETELNSARNFEVSATRSKPFYLDITHSRANKGTAVTSIAALAGVPLSQVATIGDMPVDLLMFERSAISIAMGNAEESVKAAATFITQSNDEDGLARAIDALLRARDSQEPSPLQRAM